MNKQVKILFLVLVLVQGLHSFEEYYGRLWESFPPARMLTGLFSENLESGFLFINIGLFLFGILCWIIFVRNNLRFARSLLLFWIVLEVINGIGHPVWSALQSAYTPGLLTAPVLLLLALLLYRKLKAIR